MPTPHARAKVLPRKDLVRRSEELRAAGKKLVLTNGCFDLLHVGHVRYLEAARAMGEALIVGVNSDGSVRRLKGARRPVTPAAERAEVVAALQSVDYVTIFGEETAAELVEEVKPSIYVKGGDYSGNPDDPRFPPEGRIAIGYGGEVRIVPFEAGYSTTKTLERLGARSNSDRS